MKIRGTDFILYEVADMDRSVTFYRDVLGMELEFYSKDFQWAEFKAEPTTFSIFNPAESRPDAPEPRTGGASIYLAVEDIAATVAELKEKDVTVVYGPVDSPVCHMAAILDPDGNVVGLHQRKDGTFG